MSWYRDSSCANNLNEKVPLFNNIDDEAAHLQTVGGVFP